MPRRPRPAVNGSSLLYPFLQHDLQERDIWLFQMLVSRLVVSLGIWLHPSVYRVLPIAVPFALRHPQSRGDKKLGVPDQWGTPTTFGHFMDDNTLVKNLVKSVPIESPFPHLDGHRVGTGFVASHVWQLDLDGNRTARSAETYSFLPNVLWLPTEVSRLSDRAGFTPAFLQALSHKIYRSEPVHPTMRATVDDTWALLPNPETVPPQGLPPTKDLNFFTPSAAWLTRRIDTIELIADALLMTAKGSPPSHKVFSTRYTEGLPTLGRSAARKLGKRLKLQVEAARLAMTTYPDPAT